MSFVIWDTRTIIRTISMIFSMMRSTTCGTGRSSILPTVQWWKRSWVKKCIISMISSIFWGTGLSMIRPTSWRISPTEEPSVLLERSPSWLTKRVHRKTALVRSEMRSYGMSIHCSRKSFLTGAAKICFSTHSLIRFCEMIIISSFLRSDRCFFWEALETVSRASSPRMCRHGSNTLTFSFGSVSLCGLLV